MTSEGITLAQRFHKLFEGSDIAHGTFVVQSDRSRDGKKQGTARVLRQPTTVEMWEEHLAGGVGLGIIPIRSDNNAKWGAIDIDQYDIDHKHLVTTLRKNKIPAVVGRTKSGGAHIWVFVSEFIPAGDMLSRLNTLAASLGFAGSEIFPKQSEILVDRGDAGNFLNMSYHGGVNTVRYAFDDNGEALSPEGFLDYAESFVITPEEFYNIDFTFGTTQDLLEDGPPCLQHLCRKGFGEGSRNNALFNLGVYARMRFPDDWEAAVHRFNSQYMNPPLSHGEVGIIIKQLHKKEYFYKCEDQPIKPFCDKETCKLRKYGVGNGNSTSDMTSLTKIDGDPPIWILNVDGRRVELSTEALTSQSIFQRECVGQINLLPVTVAQKTWQNRIKQLLDKLTIVEVPPDATLKGEFVELLHEFVSERAKGETRDDLINGVPVWTDDRVFFQVKDIKKYLFANEFKHYTSNKITLRLKDLGAEKIFWRIKGKGVHAWSLPQSLFNSIDEADLPPLDGDIL